MSQWIDRILGEFPADLARFWIAVDPDDVLLDERILSGLRERGFEVLPFEDPVVFRADYEERYRRAWDAGEDGPAKALVLALRAGSANELPWDYLRQGRMVYLSLTNLFSRLSYGVVRQLDPEHREALFAAHAKHAAQSLGEAATKEFILTHIFRIGPHLIARREDLWRELLRLHYRNAVLPSLLADHVESILRAQPAFAGLPISELFSSSAILLRVVQDAWEWFLRAQGIVGSRIAETRPRDRYSRIEIPFDHPDIRTLIDSMFLDGTLHPVVAEQIPGDLPSWMSVGIVRDPAALRNLVSDGLKAVHAMLPTVESTHADWGAFARRFAEILSRFHSLDTARAQGLQASLQEIQRLADEQLVAWVDKHFADLPSLPVAKGPAMVHQVPRFLALRRAAGEARVALLVFDGLAIDQWVQVREHVNKQRANLVFDESACFAWLPTLTAVSRQALFAGLKPRELADSLETTANEPKLWSRFWQDQGLRANEVFYRKGIRQTDQLDELEADLSNPTLRVAGLVIDTIDEIVHGAVLGKRGILSQIDSWCDSGFVDRLFAMLLDLGFAVYLTADHGNVEATGSGRPNQGVMAETRGERVRVYRSAQIRSDTANQFANVMALDVPGLPPDFLPLFAGARTAFSTKGERLVAHGGISVEELIVPFIKVSRAT